MPRLHVNDSFLKALKLLIDHPFVCVENDDGYFVGIVTRREILKRFNRSIYEKLQ
ncbi:CBS domain-containing protein [Acinetobacter baumannii]